MYRTARSILLGSLLLLGACDDSPELLQPEPSAPEAAAAAAGGPPFMSSSVVAGENHGCALTRDGSAYCWGANDLGQLGDGTTTASATPVAVAGGLRFASLSASGNHTCGVTKEGAASCWGWNNAGQLGDGTLTNRTLPGTVEGGIAFRRVDAGWTHTCGTTEAGAVHCWGSNQHSQLGTTVTMETCPAMFPFACSTRPLPVVTELRFSDLSVGLSHNCGVADDGVAYCWGWNAFGQLGDGTWPNRSTPTRVGGGLTFASVSAGAGHSCGTDPSGVAYCWGNNIGGGLGNGTMTSTRLPVAVAGGLRFAGISAGAGNNIFTHTCAITASGEAYCWGGNEEGQLGSTLSTETCQISNRHGIIEYACSTRPLLVTGGLSFATTDQGREFTCGRTENGQVHCWGTNALGQLGNGRGEGSSSPTRVAAPSRGRTPPKGRPEGVGKPFQLTGAE